MCRWWEDGTECTCVMLQHSNGAETLLHRAARYRRVDLPREFTRGNSEMPLDADRIGGEEEVESQVGQRLVGPPRMPLGVPVRHGTADCALDLAHPVRH
jgi:hypothetical protein